MRLLQLSELRSALDTAITGRLCVQAWLGYAQVLFVGFGDEVLPSVSSDALHPLPPYELQTCYADWSIEDALGVIGTADDDRDLATTAAQRLVGYRARAWRFIDSSLALDITFDNGLTLKITPMAGEEENTRDRDAWSLRMPDGYYNCVRWNGTLYNVAGDEPGPHEPR